MDKMQIQATRECSYNNYFECYGLGAYFYRHWNSGEAEWNAIKENCNVMIEEDCFNHFYNYFQDGVYGGKGDIKAGGDVRMAAIVAYIKFYCDKELDVLYAVQRGI